MDFDEIAGFDWDEGNWPKCAKHGLTRDEIESIFERSPAVLADRYPGELRYNAVGKDMTERFVFVVFTIRDRDGEKLIRPIRARLMHGKEIKRYVRTAPS